MSPQNAASVLPNAPSGIAGTAAFTAAVRAFALNELGVPESHPVLTGRLARRVANLLADGRIPSVRINGRYGVDPALAPKAAALLGLHATLRLI